MASATSTSPTARPAEPVIDLKNPGWAALLAWLWPGAGHFYQGRTAKGLIFMICILGTFLYGLYLGQGRVVYVYGDWRPEMFRWHFLGQAGVGLAALPAVVQAKMPDTPLFGGWYMPPRSQWELNQLHRELQRYFELGAMFTLIAGLLNILAIYDAWGGPAYTAPRVRDEPTSAADSPAAKE